MSDSPYRQVPMCARCGTATPAEQARNGLCCSCDAIRSIRIASTLNERYGQILTGRHLDSRYASELAIGEAKQLYPEIWSHFDNARDALAQARIRVPDYDRLRGAESGDAVTDVVNNGGGTVVYLSGDGHSNAKHAAQLLRAALPDVDWAALDRADANEIAAVGALTVPAWKRRLIGATVIAALVILFWIFR